MTGPLIDVVVGLHFLFVAGVIGGFVAIVAGIALRWEWIRNFWFRAIHLLMILQVVAQVAFDCPCPLTVLEKHLLERAGEPVYESSFIAKWLQALCGVDADGEGSGAAFAVVYCAFGALVLLTFVLAPPRWPWRGGRGA
jgi:hypothetical protein